MTCASRGRRSLAVGLTTVVVGLPLAAATATPETTKRLFSNPILGAGQDPSVVTHDGWYYYTQSSPDTTRITIRRSRSIKSLAAAHSVVAWRGGTAGSPCCQWWGPELHEIDGEWFIYVAADGGRNAGHRLQLLWSHSPLGPFRYAGELRTPGDLWSIDPSPLELPGGGLFMFWSGWPRRADRTQNIYVAAMRNPWTVIGRRTAVSVPTYAWERHSGGLNVDVNESPEPIVHGSTVSVTYSASGCWTPNYSLGLLHAPLGANLLSRSSWTKSPAPIFRTNSGTGVYGPASNGWFVSPDGTQTWFAFNAVRDPRGSCGTGREVYAQPVRWNPDGTPNLGGMPFSRGRLLDVPSGDPGAR